MQAYSMVIAMRWPVAIIIGALQRVHVGGAVSL